MRIGFVSTYPPTECGIATYTQSLNEALKKAGHETFVVSQSGAAGEGVFPVYSPDSTSIAADIFHTAAKLTPDVVHIQHEFGLFGAHKGSAVVDLLVKLRIADVPVITTLHTVYDDLDVQQRIVLKHVVEDSAAIVVHEEFQKETLVRCFGCEEKIAVIEHGVREVGPVDGAKQKLELEGKKIVMLCGYFRRTKGFHRVLDFFPEIAARNDDAVLVVAGKIRGWEARDYQQEFFEKLDASGFADRVVLLRGQFPQHTFDTILSAADVVVLPYELGAQSGMLAQCFALERPAATSDLPAFRALTERSGGGVTCRNNREFANSIDRILNDDGFRARLQSNIRRYVRDRAGWSRIARLHARVYDVAAACTSNARGRYVYFPEVAVT